MVCAARTYKGGTFLTPSAVAREIEKMAPRMIIKIIAFSLSPNQSNDSGSQQILGMVCSPIIKEPIVSSANLTRPIRIPNGIPINIESRYPMRIRFKLASMARVNVLSLKPINRVSQTCKGDGNNALGQTCNLNTTSQIVIRRNRKIILRI